jgi:hypothetical protein
MKRIVKKFVFFSVDDESIRIFYNFILMNHLYLCIHIHLYSKSFIGKEKWLKTVILTREKFNEIVDFFLKDLQDITHWQMNKSLKKCGSHVVNLSVTNDMILWDIRLSRSRNFTVTLRMQLRNTTRIG